MSRNFAGPVFAVAFISWIVASSPGFTSWHVRLNSQLIYWRYTLLLHQDWRMFRTPQADHRHLFADLHYSDGASEQWEVPLANEIGYFHSLRLGRMAKWLETASTQPAGSPFSRAILTDASRYLDRFYPHASASPLTHIKWFHGDDRLRSPIGRVDLRAPPLIPASLPPDLAPRKPSAREGKK